MIDLRSKEQKKQETRARRALSPLARYVIDINQQSTDQEKLTRAIVHNVPELVHWFCIHYGVTGASIYSDLSVPGAYTLSLACGSIKECWETILLLLSVTDDISEIVNSAHEVPYISPLNSVLICLAWSLEGLHGYGACKDKVIYLLKALLLKGAALDCAYPSLAGYDAQGYLERFILKDQPDCLAEACQILEQAKVAVAEGNFRLDPIDMGVISPDALPLTPVDHQKIVEYRRVVMFMGMNLPHNIVGLLGQLNMRGRANPAVRGEIEHIESVNAFIDEFLESGEDNVHESRFIIS